MGRELVRRGIKQRPAKTRCLASGPFVKSDGTTMQCGCDTSANNQHPHLEPFHLLPAAPGNRPECATAHEPEMPHDQQSLAYQYDFFGKNGRWPTWEDAMAHCTPDVQQRWKEQLRLKGVKI